MVTLPGLSNSGARVSPLSPSIVQSTHQTCCATLQTAVYNNTLSPSPTNPSLVVLGTRTSTCQHFGVSSLSLIQQCRIHSISTHSHPVLSTNTASKEKTTQVQPRERGWRRLTLQYSLLLRYRRNLVQLILSNYSTRQRKITPHTPNLSPPILQQQNLSDT